MSGICEDCGRQTLICGTCKVCVLCHPEGLEFCMVDEDEEGCLEHYFVKGNDLVAPPRGYS